MRTGWISGHRLRKNTGVKKDFYSKEEHIVPDSLFGMDSKNGLKTISLELELIPKSKRRYSRILDLYLNNKEIDYLWYIVPSLSIGKKVLEQVDISDYRKPYDWVMYSNLEELRTNSKEARLYFKKKTIRLKDFYQTKTQKDLKKPAHSKAHRVSSFKSSEDLWSKLN